MNHYFSKIYVISLLIMQTFFSLQAAAISPCDKEFNDHTSISAGGDVGASVKDDVELKKAEWALDFLNRCGGNINQVWAGQVKANQPEIEKRIAAYKGTKDSAATAHAACPDSDECANKMKNYKISDWYSHKPESLKALTKMSDGVLTDIADDKYYPAEAHKFGETCSCYVKNNNLSAQFDIATQFLAQFKADNIEAKKAPLTFRFGTILMAAVC